MVRHPGIPRKIGGKLCIDRLCYTAALSFAAGEAGGSVARFGVPGSLTTRKPACTDDRRQRADEIENRLAPFAVRIYLRADS
jgi:hypothetical protein